MYHIPIAYMKLWWEFPVLPPTKYFSPHYIQNWMQPQEVVFVWCTRPSPRRTGIPYSLLHVVLQIPSRRCLPSISPTLPGDLSDSHGGRDMRRREDDSNRDLRSVGNSYTQYMLFLFFFACTRVQPWNF
jgi:hypothetical protein